MKYNLTDASEIIRRLDNDYNVNHADYLTRLPSWIYQALREINYINAFLPASYYASVTNYKAYLPTDLYSLSGIEYNGYRLTKGVHPVKKESVSYSTDPVITSNVGITVYGRTSDIRISEEITEEIKDIEIDIDQIRRYEAFNILTANVGNESYVVMDNYIETSFEEGNVWFHYYKLPQGYNEILGSLCPYIPDNEETINCITLYCFKCILQRGFKHPTMSLESNNPYTNVGMLYKDAKKKSRNSLNEWDRDDSQRIINIMNSALYNQITG